MPRSPEALLGLPGVGPYTASAVAAFAFEEPTIFIETNIRTVFTYIFFKDRKSVSDEEILPLIARTLYPKIYAGGTMRSWIMEFSLRGKCHE